MSAYRTFGLFSVWRWNGSTWVVMRERSDGARIVWSTPFKLRREACEWAEHFNRKEQPCATTTGKP